MSYIPPQSSSCKNPPYGIDSNFSPYPRGSKSPQNFRKGGSKEARIKRTSFFHQIGDHTGLFSVKISPIPLYLLNTSQNPLSSALSTSNSRISSPSSVSSLYSNTVSRSPSPSKKSRFLPNLESDHLLFQESLSRSPSKFLSVLPTSLEDLKPTQVPFLIDQLTEFFSFHFGPVASVYIPLGTNRLPVKDFCVIRFKNEESLYNLMNFNELSYSPSTPSLSLSPTGSISPSKVSNLTPFSSNFSMNSSKSENDFESISLNNFDSINPSSSMNFDLSIYDSSPKHFTPTSKNSPNSTSSPSFFTSSSTSSLSSPKVYRLTPLQTSPQKEGEEVVDIFSSLGTSSPKKRSTKISSPSNFKFTSPPTTASSSSSISSSYSNTSSPDLPLSSCRARSGYPWTTLRPLKFLVPHSSSGYENSFTIKLKNIQVNVSVEKLRNIFLHFGEILEVHSILPQYERIPSEHNGEVYLRYLRKESYEKCLIFLNEIKEKKIQLNDENSFLNEIDFEGILPGTWPTEKTRRYY